MRHLVQNLVAADKTEIVARRHLVRRAKGDRERLSRGDVLPGLVRRVYADGYLILQRNSAPCGISTAYDTFFTG